MQDPPSPPLDSAFASQKLRSWSPSLAYARDFDHLKNLRQKLRRVPRVRSSLSEAKKTHLIIHLKTINKPKFLRRNEYIRIPEVFVIDENGQKLGSMPNYRALALAREKGLDLVEVSPLSRPPICKIMDYGQYQYKQEKAGRKQKAKIKKVGIKGIRISFKIGEHDLEVRRKQAKKFFEQRHKVRIEMLLRGREKAHQDIAQENMRKFVDSLEGNIIFEQGIKKLGSKFTCILVQK